MNKPHLQSLFIVCIILAGSPEHAVACFPGFEDAILFDQEDIGRDVDAPVIVDITVIKAAMEKDYRVIAAAKINKKIKGDIDGETVRIVLNLSSCDRGFRIGARGIIFGAIQRSPAGDQEITPIRETIHDRFSRRLRFGSPSTR